MDADEAIEALTTVPTESVGLRETMGYHAQRSRAKRFIREAFADAEVADRARAELEELDRWVSLDPRADSFETYRLRLTLKRIVGEGS